MAHVKAGIYLELKKGVIGVGHTAKEEEYRNFWMTVDQKGDEVVCILLDNEFKPTGIRQNLPAGAFESGRLTYIPQGEKRYQILIKHIREKELAVQSKPQPKPAAAPEEKKPKGWWEAPEKDIQPGDIFKREEKTPGKAPTSPSSGNWWDPNPKNLTPEDIFGRGSMTGAKKPTKPTKKNLKKSWWDK